MHAEEVTAYGIASVFTPLEKRRCGYAQHMMRLLHWVLAPRSTLSADFPDAWGAPPAAPDGFGNAQFSVLYSDVGPDFYRLCGPTQYPGNGWIERGSTLTSWNVPPSEDTLSSKVLSSTWKYLTEDDAIRVWEADAAWMKIYLANMRPSTSRTCFTFLPNQGVAKFLIHRTMSFNKDLTPVLPLQTWGILRLPHANAGLEDVLGDDERQGSTFATWSLDPTSASGTLIVTRLRATTDTFPELFGRLTEFSREQKIERIEIWALPETLQGIASNLGGVTEQRQEHLSAFKWYGKEPEELEWIFNEKSVVPFAIILTRPVMDCGWTDVYFTDSVGAEPFTVSSTCKYIHFLHFGCTNIMLFCLYRSILYDDAGGFLVFRNRSKRYVMQASVADMS